MAESKSKKRYPSQDFYRALHAFFNKEAREFPGNKYKFEEVMNELGYTIGNQDRHGEYIILPNGDKTYTSRHTFQVRFSEVIEDIGKRLKNHGIFWSVKEGQKKATKYGYAEPVAYNLPEECKLDKTLNDIELLKEIIGYTRTPYSNKEVEREIISFASGDLFGNIDFVKEIFLAIRERKVVEFTYHAANSNHPKHHVLSPHYLKQYNQRWFLFGYTEEVTDPDDDKVSADSHPREGFYTFAVDRIDDDFKLRTDLNYHEPQSIDYTTYFDDIVGVTHFTDRPTEPVDVFIQTYSKYIHNLLVVNPIHSSQVQMSPFKSKNKPGLICLHVCINQELERQLLGYGKNIKAEWKGKSYKDFLKSVSRMKDRYFG